MANTVKPTGAEPPQDGREWREIPGYPGYWAATDGVLWSSPKIVPRGGKRGGFYKTKGRYLKTVIGGNGIMQTTVGSSLNGKKREKCVSRCVLLAFAGPPPTPAHVAVHVNSNPSDNRIENLFWGTNQDRGDAQVMNGATAHGEKSGHAKLSEADVIAIRRRARRGESIASIAVDYPVVPETVGMAVRRKTWRHTP